VSKVLSHKNERTISGRKKYPEMRLYLPKRETRVRRRGRGVTTSQIRTLISAQKG